MIRLSNGLDFDLGLPIVNIAFLVLAGKELNETISFRDILGKAVPFLVLASTRKQLWPSYSA